MKKHKQLINMFGHNFEACVWLPRAGMTQLRGDSWYEFRHLDLLCRPAYRVMVKQLEPALLALVANG